MSLKCPAVQQFFSHSTDTQWPFQHSSETPLQALLVFNVGMKPEWLGGLAGCQFVSSLVNKFYSSTKKWNLSSYKPVVNWTFHWLQSVQISRSSTSACYFSDRRAAVCVHLSMILSFPLQVGVIDFSMYLKDGGHSSKSAEGWVLLLHLYFSPQPGAVNLDIVLAFIDWPSMVWQFTVWMLSSRHSRLMWIHSKCV